MNLLSSFIDFYNSLSSDGLFFFWIILFLFIFLIFLCIILLIKNNSLTKLLREERENIKSDVHEEDDEEIILKKNEEPPAENIKEHITNEPIKEEPKGPYSKNVLREIGTRTQTSPIHIDKKVEEVSYNYLKEDLGNASPLEELDDQYEANDDMLFASEIVRQMEEEIKPSNIELTDYEKKQEEEAIISYDELLKVKDKIYNITEDEEDGNFIDELKSFRLDLK